MGSEAFVILSIGFPFLVAMTGNSVAGRDTEGRDRGLISKGPVPHQALSHRGRYAVDVGAAQDIDAIGAQAGVDDGPAIGDRRVVAAPGEHQKQ
jgi:hypothetical protein